MASNHFTTFPSINSGTREYQTLLPSSLLEPIVYSSSQVRQERATDTYMYVRKISNQTKKESYQPFIIINIIRYTKGNEMKMKMKHDDERMARCY